MRRRRCAREERRVRSKEREGNNQDIGGAIGSGHRWRLFWDLFSLHDEGKPVH